MIAYKIIDCEIIDVISIADDVTPPDGYVIDDGSIPAGTGGGCRLVDGVWTAPAPAPASTPVAPPPRAPLTARQLRLGLLRINIKPADVAAAINALPADQRDQAEIEWDYASEYRRDHPLIATLGDSFGLSAQAIDAAWREAMAL